MSVPGDGQWEVPYAWECKHRTAHCRRTGPIPAIALETRALLRRDRAEHRRARELLIQSRELLKQIQAELTASRCMGFIRRNNSWLAPHRTKADERNQIGAAQTKTSQDLIESWDVVEQPSPKSALKDFRVRPVR